MTTMAKTRLVLALLLVVPVFSSYPFPTQETSVTRTHLMRDIEESSLIIGIGLESFGEDPEYMSDTYFGYLGYAPFDWLEAGLAVHCLTLGLYPSVDGRIDLLEIFTDSTRVSCFLMGGVGGLPGDPDYPLFYHGGAAVNYRVTRWLQLYAGAGSDSVATALALQAGVYLAPLNWLGASVNFKLVIGPEGVEPMISAAPLVVVQHKN
jgi:hypothetical protein